MKRIKYTADNFIVITTAVAYKITCTRGPYLNSITKSKKDHGKRQEETVLNCDMKSKQGKNYTVTPKFLLVSRNLQNILKNNALPDRPLKKHSCNLWCNTRGLHEHFAKAEITLSKKIWSKTVGPAITERSALDKINYHPIQLLLGF